MLIGEILTATAVVGGDKTSVYSEYEVRVEQLLKQDAKHPLALGSMVTGVRQGGTIRFPSGHIRHYIVSGIGFPKRGSHYLLFLSQFPDADGDDFVISTGYELTNGIAFALDDEPPFNRFDGTALSTLVQLTMEAMNPRGESNAHR